MCIKEDPIEYTWRCGHIAPDILGSEINWCDEALRRGRLCADIKPSDKERSRVFAERNACPNCRPRRRASEGAKYEHHDDDEHDKVPAPRQRLGSVGPSGVITGV